MCSLKILHMVILVISKCMGGNFLVELDILQNVAIYLPAVVLCLLVRHFVTDAFFLHFIVASVLLLAYFVAVQCLYLKNPFVLAKLHALHAWLFSRQKP